MSFSKINYFRKYLVQIKLYKYFSTERKSSPFFKSEENSTTKVENHIQDKIIYSSVLENQKFNLGYKNSKILQEILEKRQKNERQENKTKPFPVSLKFLQENINNNETVLKTCDENEKLTKHYPDEFVPEKRFPENWMQDYEFFDEDDTTLSTTNGTPDPTIPPSKIPCNGCGALLHCADIGLPGYIPSEIFKDRTNTELKRIICQRCHFLKMYNIALDISVTPEMYVDVLSTIKDKFALAVLIVDLLDFPCSFWPGINDLLGDKRPIFVVGNKVDLLPKDSPGYLSHIKNCLTEVVLQSGLSKLNLKHICLISAKTGFGVEELITQLHKIWGYKGDVYLIGCTNVGKSSLFNALLASDYCKVQASELIQRATTCIWPGTTLKMLKFPILRPSDIRIYQRFQRLFSERAQKQAEEKLRRHQLRKTDNVEYATLIGHIGQTYKMAEDISDPFGASQGTNPILTLDERSKEYINSKWCFDTPGVIHSDQIHHFLTTEELLLMTPRKMIRPRVFRLKPEMSLFLGGLARFDFVSSNINAIRVTVYSSLMLPILITKLNDASEIYDNLLGSDLLAVPKGDEDRLKRFPKLIPSECIKLTGEANDKATCDITFSSAGWIGLSIPLEGICTFQVWTPEKRGIHVRRPSLIPFGENLRGKKIRGSLAYKLGNPFIK